MMRRGTRRRIRRRTARRRVRTTTRRTRRRTPASRPDKQKDDGNADKQKEEKKEDTKKKEEKPKPVEIDLAGFEERVLPPKAGRYDSLATISGKLLYRRQPRVGSARRRTPVVFYDLEKREEKTVMEDADFVELSANREKLLVRQGNDYAIVEPKEGQKMDKKIDTGSFEAPSDPVARAVNIHQRLAAGARLFLRPRHARG